MGGLSYRVWAKLMTIGGMSGGWSIIPSMGKIEDNWGETAYAVVGGGGGDEKFTNVKVKVRKEKFKAMKTTGACMVACYLQALHFCSKSIL